MHNQKSLLSLTLTAAVLSFSLATGCLGTRAVVNDLDGDAGTAGQGGTFLCTPGQWYSDPCAAEAHSRCAAQGQRAALYCPPSGRVIGAATACACIAQNVGGTCSSPSQACSVPCNGGSFAGTMTCTNGVWGGCQVNVGATCSGGTGTTCTAGQVETGCSASCAQGQTTQRVCSNNAWGACTCVGTPTGTGCTAGTTQACSLSCGSNQTPRQTCNSAGQWEACTCVSTGGGPTTGGNHTLRVAVPTNFGGNFCTDSAQLRVVIYDNRGCPIGREDSATAPVPGTSTACGNDATAQRDRTISFGDSWNGYVDVEIYCGSNLYRGFSVGQTLSAAGFSAFSVSRGGNSYLLDQLGDANKARAISVNKVRGNVGPGNTISF